MLNFFTNQVLKAGIESDTKSRKWIRNYKRELDRAKKRWLNRVLKVETESGAKTDVLSRVLQQGTVSDPKSGDWIRYENDDWIGY